MQHHSFKELPFVGLLTSHSVLPSTSSLSLHLPAFTLPTRGPNQREFTLLLLSWVLPGSGSRAAELTHSSAGPMPPQSSTAPLRTLEYSSAARPGQPGGRRQESGSEDRSPLSLFHLGGEEEAAGLGVSRRSESAISTGTGNVSRKPQLNLCLNSVCPVGRSTRRRRPEQKWATWEGVEQGCFQLNSSDITFSKGIMGISRKKAQMQHFLNTKPNRSQRVASDGAGRLVSPRTAETSRVHSNFLYIEVWLDPFFLFPHRLPPPTPPPPPKAENLWSQDFYLAHWSCGHVKSEAHGRS